MKIIIKKLRRSACRRNLTTMLVAILIIVVSCLQTTALAAEPIDKDADPVPVVSSGSFTCDTWIHTSMDSFTVGGGSLTAASWDFDRGYVFYELTGTFKAGETLSLSIAGTMGPMGYAMEHEGNYLDMHLECYDTSDNELKDLTQVVQIDASTSASLSDSVSFQIPDYVAEVELYGSFRCKWSTPGAVASETVGVKVILTSESETQAQPTPSPEASSDSGSWWTASTSSPNEPEVPFPISDGDPSWFSPDNTCENPVVRFGDMHGEIDVKRYGEDDDCYIFAELNTPLHHGDVIRILPNSAIILSYSDMTSLEIKGPAVIVLDIAIPTDTKIGLLVDNIWMNFKSMVETGHIEVEMYQAAAGIKGTTFICEDDGETSTLKVIEGTVEYTSKADGETVMVSDGQMCSATSEGLGPVMDFDIQDEMENWDEDTRERTAEILAEKASEGTARLFLILAACLGALALIALILFLILRSKRSRHVPDSRPASYPVYQRCTNCGATLPENTKFCVTCGKAVMPAPPVFCTGCGAPIARNAAFCDRCGKAQTIRQSIAPPSKKPTLWLIIVIAAAALALLCVGAYFLFFSGNQAAVQTAVELPEVTAETVTEQTVKPTAVDYAATRNASDLIGVWEGYLEYMELSGDWEDFDYPVSVGYSQPIQLQITEESPVANYQQAILRIDGGDVAALSAGFEGRFLEIRGEWQSCDVWISVEYDEENGGFKGTGEYIHSEKHASFDFFMSLADDSAWDSDDFQTTAETPAQPASETVVAQTITVSMEYDSGEGVYTGEVKDGVPNGQGSFEMVTSDNGLSWRYEGQWENGEITGEGVMMQDSLVFTGGFRGGLLNGSCEIMDNGVLRYKGICQDGKLHGAGTLYTKSGMLLFEGEFDSDMLVENAAARQARGEAFMPECDDMDDLLYDGCMAEDNTLGYPVAVWGFPIAMGEQTGNGTIVIGHMGDDAYPVCLVYRYGVDETKMAWDDWINAWGVVIGTYEYEDANGSMVTCPMVEVVFWDNSMENYEE